MRIWLGVAVVLSSGCSTLPPEVLGPPPAGPPAPAVQVLLEVDYEPTDPDLDPEQFRPPYRPRLSAEPLLDSLAETLRRRGGFEQVLVGPDAQAPLRLELVLEDARVTLAGRNWVHPLKIVNLIVSSVLILPTVDPLNWILPGEDYALETRVRWRLRDGQGATLGRGVLRPEFRDSFAAFGLGGIAGRPWFYLGFLRVPECLDPADWAVISSQLEAHAQTVLVQSVVAAAEAARPETPVR
ncbi:MAG: hypothetical protein KDD82_09905 [Planctomycetes bacterium]|nr:hypothetical protein [Planctomycetota bacterium]